jgi:hypothetical protein
MIKGIRLGMPTLFCDYIKPPNHSKARMYFSFGVEFVVETWIQLAFPAISSPFTLTAIGFFQVFSLFMGSLWLFKPYVDWMESGIL